MVIDDKIIISKYMAIMYNCGYFITNKHYRGHETGENSLTSVQAGVGTAQEEQNDSDLQAHPS